MRGDGEPLARIIHTGMGSTGDSPVPSGDSPLGRKGAWNTLSSLSIERVSPFRPASGRTRQVGGVFYP